MNDENTEKKSILMCVNFKLGEEWYGQDISSIQEVNRVQEITDVPGSPEYILGVINIMGNVIPVMDLRKRLGLPDMAMTTKSRVIVVEHEESLLGLLVDSVHHVIEIPFNMISDTPETAVTKRNKFISGIGRLKDKLIFILDIGKIFDEEFKSKIDHHKLEKEIIEG
ncbi:MAG: purine-binding chemotaxis protein CheW [Candidatus Krumholzibacteriota bacterium]|nr:purine-binding chemotaxis protein CheW [Candidatus Krumholzibacteriota bacterium]